ncbi:hypothetical protein D9M69_565200 [compost metagenome]
MRAARARRARPRRTIASARGSSGRSPPAAPAPRPAPRRAPCPRCSAPGRHWKECAPANSSAASPWQRRSPRLPPWRATAHATHCDCCPCAARSAHTGNRRARSPPRSPRNRNPSSTWARAPTGRPRARSPGHASRRRGTGWHRRSAPHRPAPGGARQTCAACLPSTRAQKGFTTTRITMPSSSSTGNSLNQRYQRSLRRLPPAAKRRSSTPQPWW